MPHQTIKTNSEIAYRLLEITAQQKILMELFLETDDQIHLEQFEILSTEFQTLREQLRKPDIGGYLQ